MHRVNEIHRFCINVRICIIFNLWEPRSELEVIAVCDSNNVFWEIWKSLKAITYQCENKEACHVTYVIFL
ncbi:hypothetical protein Hanom_Chr08g00683871 [Helianthus anomalus]